MASYTTNLNLKKPAGSENVAIGDINNNMDTIDNAYGTVNDKISHTPYKVSGAMRMLSATGNRNTINIVLKTSSSYWGGALVLIGFNLYTVNFNGPSSSTLSIGHGGTMTVSWNSDTKTYTLQTSNSGQAYIIIYGSLASDENFNTISVE